MRKGHWAFYPGKRFQEKFHKHSSISHFHWTDITRVCLSPMAIYLLVVLSFSKHGRNCILNIERGVEKKKTFSFLLSLQRIISSLRLRKICKSLYNKNPCVHLFKTEAMKKTREREDVYIRLIKGQVINWRKERNSWFSHQ